MLAVEDGYRESTESWAAVMRDLKERGLNEPRLVVGDGALGTWAALRDVFPGARRQACWVHKIARVLDALPKRLQPAAKKLLHEIMEAPTRRTPGLARERFREQFDAKYPKAVAKLDKDWARLTAFYEFPAEHWRHLRTSNAIESSFATVKLRTRVTKGAGSKKAALAMAYKLLDAAQERWRRFNGHELVADVLAGAEIQGRLSASPTTRPQRPTRRSPPDFCQAAIHVRSCGVDEDAEREGFRWLLGKARPRRGRSLRASPRLRDAAVDDPRSGDAVRWRARRTVATLARRPRGWRPALRVVSGAHRGRGLGGDEAGRHQEPALTAAALMLRHRALGRALSDGHHHIRGA